VRLGVIADVHANLPALEAAVAALERIGVDRYVCLGDIVGYGPFPDACVRLITQLGAATVAGNHDLIATGRLPGAVISELAASTLRWTAEVLDERSRDYLGALPLVLAVEPKVVIAHGSLADPSVYVRRAGDAERELGRLRETHPGAELLLLGHTHESLAHRAGGATMLFLRPGEVRLNAGIRHLLNPGSVGQSRQWSRAARALWVDLDEGIARFLAVDYSARAARSELRRLGLPREGLHWRPPPWRSGPVKRLHRRWLEARMRGADGGTPPPDAGDKG
jgi:predicted phosphodiesterase